MRQRAFFFLLFLSIRVLATHIVGGEMYYDYLGNDQYRITLKIYRDCFNGQAPFDDSPIITIRQSNGTLTGRFGMGDLVITNIQPVINTNCIQAPNTVCVEEGVYTYT